MPEKTSLNPAQDIHINIQNKIKELNKVPPHELTVYQEYQRHILNIMDGWYDDLEDMKNWDLALRGLVELFKPLEKSE